MIYNITINNTDHKQAVCPWWHQVDFLKGRQKIEFSPGLNVIFGANGSGKSTVITTIAKLLCCYDGDQQLVGRYTNSDLNEGGHSSRKLKLGVEPKHDGSPIMHFDPSQSTGLIDGTFDWDFIDMGMQNSTFKGSAGQRNLMRMNRCIATAIDPNIKWPAIRWKGTHPDNHPELAKFIKGDSKRIRPTLLLDEPTSNLDLQTEIRFFQVLQKIVDSGVQVIIATHSVFALHMKNATYIDTVPGYSTGAQIDTENHFLKTLMEVPERLHVLMNLVRNMDGKTKVKNVPL